mgnify:CR=1
MAEGWLDVDMLYPAAVLFFPTSQQDSVETDTVTTLLPYTIMPDTLVAVYDLLHSKATSLFYSPCQLVQHLFV